jgi:phage-related protein
MADPTWVVDFYVDIRKDCPVKEFILTLQPKERAAVLHDIELLRTHGTDLTGPYVDHLGAGLWELRSGRARIFYFLHIGRRFILLSGYYNKSKKAPANEIAMARRRLADFLERN